GHRDDPFGLGRHHRLAQRMLDNDRKFSGHHRNRGQNHRSDPNQNAHQITHNYRLPVWFAARYSNSERNTPGARIDTGLTSNCGSSSGPRTANVTPISPSPSRPPKIGPRIGICWKKLLSPNSGTYVPARSYCPASVKTF